MSEAYCCGNCGRESAPPRPLIGGFTLTDFGLQKGNQVLHLTRHEYEILTSIISSHPKPRPVWAIADDTWGERANYVSSEKMVHIYIHKMRKKFADAGVRAAISHVNKYTAEHGYVITDHPKELA